MILRGVPALAGLGVFGDIEVLSWTWRMFCFW